MEGVSHYHTLLAHTIQGALPVAATVGKSTPRPSLWADCLSLTPKSFWNGTLGITNKSGCLAWQWEDNRTVLTYAVGATLWVELTISNDREKSRVEPCAPRTAFQSIPNNHQCGHWKETGDFFPCWSDPPINSLSFLSARGSVQAGINLIWRFLLLACKWNRMSQQSVTDLLSPFIPRALFALINPHALLQRTNNHQVLLI